MGQGGLALDLVLWLPMCLFQIAFFGMNASLKWMTWQSKLKSGAYITKKKKADCQAEATHHNLPHIFCTSRLCFSFMQTDISVCVCVVII